MNVVIIGLGMVGYGLYEQLKKDNSMLTVHGVMDKNQAILDGLDCKKYENIDQVVSDKEVDIVVELIGGITPAVDFIKKALVNGKHVVTANKAVISKHYQELHQLAKDNHAILRYEASVGGGIIVLDPLVNLSKFAHITKMYGIINGSTNYILSKVFNEDYTMKDAIQKANDLGYLETGTTDDMDGLDLKRKINIMSMLAYHGVYDENKITTMPLSNLSDQMIEYAKNHNKIIKYLAFSYRDHFAFVAPFLLPKSSPLATIHDATNQIYVYSETSDWLVFQGEGAGRYPTSTAVLYDLYQLLDHNQYPVHLEHTLTFKHPINLFNVVLEKKDGTLETISKQQVENVLTNNDFKPYMLIWEE